MSVASHLGIDLGEYDARIRTFIPDYDELLDAGAAALSRSTRAIVDLGIGTGALSERCLARAPRARVVGIDADREILHMAATRLSDRVRPVAASFLRAALPRCDAVVASFALHHVRTRTAKQQLYHRIHRALQPRGVFVTVDCHPSCDRVEAASQFDAWRAHLRRSYSKKEADALLKAWSKEDVYVPMEAEVELMNRAGFTTDVVWRRGAFAVLRALSASARR